MFTCTVSSGVRCLGHITNGVILYIYIYLSKLKSGERLTPPKANVCDEHVYGAMRACGARYMRAVTHAVRDIRAQ